MAKGDWLMVNDGELYGHLCPEESGRCSCYRSVTGWVFHSLPTSFVGESYCTGSYMDIVGVSELWCRRGCTAHFHDSRRCCGLLLLQHQMLGGWGPKPGTPDIDPTSLAVGMFSYPLVLDGIDPSPGCQTECVWWFKFCGEPRSNAFVCVASHMSTCSGTCTLLCIWFLLYPCYLLKVCLNTFMYAKPFMLMYIAMQVDLHV